MPRAHRLHAPGAGTHITARLQGGARLFSEDLRDSVAELICEAAQFSGANILALVIMPNHFHVVAKQSGMPLGWMMQCAMQRISLLIRRYYGGEGHVFGRRYWSCICDNPTYLRQAILYTHLNPWKAGICSDPMAYPWSSQAAFSKLPAASNWMNAIAVEQARLLFARERFTDGDIDANYNAFLDFAKERYLTAVPGDRLLYDWSNDLGHPCAPLGDEHWTAAYSHIVPQRHQPVEKLDLRDRAVAVLHSMGVDCTLDDLRAGKRIRGLGKIRSELIAVLLSAKYRPSAIARCLFVSATTVSKVAADIRRGAVRYRMLR